MKIAAMSSLLLILTIPFYGQVDSIKLKKYIPSYKFKDGIYLNIEQVQNNSPIPKSRLVVSIDENDINFFNKILEVESLVLYDNLGLKKEIKTKNIWGFCRNGHLFINHNTEFNQIFVIGSLCTFVANKLVLENRPYDPFYYNYYSYPYSTMRPTSTSTEMRQYILDFKAGQVYDFSKEAMLVLLMKDPELYDEYNALSSKKQNKLVFFYIRKYNERNPLYLPAE